jgi:hypothetical protein
MRGGGVLSNDGRPGSIVVDRETAFYVIDPTTSRAAGSGLRRNV